MAQFKVVVTDTSFADTTLEEAAFREAGLDVQVRLLNTRSPAEIIPQVGDADALLVVYAEINRQVIEHLHRCRVISRYGVGVDMIDLAAAREHGIPVCNVPDYCVPEVSTHTLTLILSLNRRLMPQDRHVRQGGWFPPPIETPARLQGQVLGLVGLGRIGQAVARGAMGLGMQVLAHDPYASEERARALGVELVGLEELLRRSDYVSVHCPLTEQTRHLIGAAQLALMKPTAFLINVSRGPIVDQSALYQALANRRIAGAGLDVQEWEPPRKDEPLTQLDNVVLTPHTAYWSDQSVVDLRRGVVANVATVLQGKPPRNVVN